MCSSGSLDYNSFPVGAPEGAACPGALVLRWPHFGPLLLGSSPWDLRCSHVLLSACVLVPSSAAGIWPLCLGQGRIFLKIEGRPCPGGSCRFPGLSSGPAACLLVGSRPRLVLLRGAGSGAGGLLSWYSPRVPGGCPHGPRRWLAPGTSLELSLVCAGAGLEPTRPSGSSPVAHVRAGPMRPSVGSMGHTPAEPGAGTMVVFLR